MFSWQLILFIGIPGVITGDMRILSMGTSMKMTINSNLRVTMFSPLIIPNNEEERFDSLLILSLHLFFVFLVIMVDVVRLHMYSPTMHNRSHIQVFSVILD